MPRLDQRAQQAQRVQRALALVAALSFGCGPAVDSTFARAIAAGDRAKTAGRHLEAAQAFESAGNTARDPRDRTYALSLAASSYARGHNRADAMRILDVLAATPPEGGSVSVRARFDRALLVLETDEAPAVEALERFAVDYPESALARRALAIVLERRAGSDANARLVILERVLPRTRGKDLEQRVRYEIALAHESLGELPRARDELLSLATDFPYPKGSLWDDSLFHASEIEERLGRHEPAIAHLERMIRERETTHLIGSYERPKYRPAAMRIATLYRDRLNDPHRARAAFMRVYEDFTHSTYRDDALFEAALLSRQIGEMEAACSAMRKLLRTLPNSRYVACATRLCPAIGEGATKPCATYIEKKIPPLPAK